MSEQPLDLLALPYDVRHLIYEHLFPSLHQIHILADEGSLQLYHQQAIPISILQVNRQLHKEAAEFLYNSYLFNIIGRKQDCLRSYRPFLKTLSKYARNTVRLDAFSNGEHSATACLSIQSGTSQLKTLEDRGRGEQRTIQELQREVDGKARWSSALLHELMSPGYLFMVAALLALVACVLGFTFPISLPEQ